MLRTRARGRNRGSAQARFTAGVTLLRTFGTNANVWTPGIGNVNGLQAGNFLDSAGTTPATVDGLIGRINDAEGTLGAERVTNGTFDTDTAWAKGAGWSISGGVASFPTPAGTNSLLSQNIGLVTGKHYRITYSLTVLSGSFVIYAGGGGAGIARSASGEYSEIIVGGTDAFVYAFSLAGFSGSVDNISVRELTGIHATQATTGNKPTLRLVNGKYSVEFNGTTNYLSLSAAPFQMADNFALIATVKATGAGSKTVFSSHPTGAGLSRLMCALNATGQVVLTFADDIGTTVTVTSPLTYLNTSIVIGVLKTTNTVSLRVNGVEVATGSTATLGATTLALSSIGAAISTPTNLHNGNIFNVMSIKATVTVAQMLTEERYSGLFDSVSF